jgi:acetate CoA/acetoacetate CoA-transferase alpha subunit
MGIKKREKVVSIKEAVAKIEDSMRVMVGGFLGNGSAENMIGALVEKGVRGLTLICNDSGIAGKGIARLIESGCCAKLIASYIGACPESGRRMQTGEMDVELVPQGTLAERIRAHGSGLGGVLTPTGVGTVVEEGKERLRVGGRDYLLERPLGADVALLGGSIVDRAGNVLYRRSTRNFNPLMALAADVVIVEAKQIVEVGEIDPDTVMTPGLLVDWIVRGGV